VIFEGKTPGRRNTERRWSIAQASTVTGRDAVAWVYAPHFIGNPYQALLTSRMADYDIASIGATNIADGVRALKSAQHVGERVLHLHWLNGVLSGAATAQEARSRVDAFEKQLDTVKRAGVCVVWTMHNVLPHESVFEDQEVRVRELIVEHADLVHIMNPDSASMAAEYFTLPADKVVRVEHPGYQGYYPQWMSRATARQQFGFTPGEQVLLVLGAIKPYKGLADLSSTIDTFSSAHPRTVSLLIAGSAGTDAGTRELLAMADRHPAIHVLPERILPDDVGMLFAAADAAVIPYTASLNSGALVLALSMGTPVIARATAGSTHLLSSGGGVIYRNDHELTQTLLQPQWQSDAAVAASAMAARLRPAHMADVFGRVARAFVDHGVGAAQAVAGPNGGLDD
jgi:glycosyltransferase involved in cell wall biosynthesis